VSKRGTGLLVVERWKLTGSFFLEHSPFSSFSMMLLTFLFQSNPQTSKLNVKLFESVELDQGCEERRTRGGTFHGLAVFSSLDSMEMVLPPPTPTLTPHDSEQTHKMSSVTLIFVVLSRTKGGSR